MIFFFNGDSNIIFQKSEKTADALLSKKPDASLFKINSENFCEPVIDELIGGQALFSNKYIVMLSRICENEENFTLVKNKIREIQNSENVFLWIETIDEKEKIDFIKKHASKTITAEPKSTGPVKQISIFDLASLVAQKNKKDSWVLYQKISAIYSPEEIYGSLWWQVKSILTVMKSKNKGESGMKDFPYQKSKKYAENFSLEEISKLGHDLINGYHESRIKNTPLNLVLEKIILE